MSFPHSPPPSRNGATNNEPSKPNFNNVYHDARDLPISPTTSLDLTSLRLDDPKPDPETTEPEINPLKQITSPPYWLQSSAHQRSNSSTTMLAGTTTGITLLDNTASEEGQRKNSGCWARGVKIEEFVVCQGNKVVVAGGRVSSGRLMGLVDSPLSVFPLRIFSRGVGRPQSSAGKGQMGEIGGLGLGNGFGAFVVWNVEVETLEGGSILIRKRYSEFEKLREELLMTFPNSKAAMPDLPPKSVISKFRPRFLEQRRVGLVYFMNCILLNPEFSGSPVLKDFLFS